VNHPFHPSLLLAFLLPAHGLTIRGYDPAVHDRLSGFPAAPVMNPNFLYDASKFTGVGWWDSGSGSGITRFQISAVTPRHLLCASHARPGPGAVIHFVDSSGTAVQRTVSDFSYVPNDLGGSSDLCVIELATPLPATVAPFRWLNLVGGQQKYSNTEIRVLGGLASAGALGAGQGTITGFQDIESLPVIAKTRACYFDYQVPAGLANDCALTGGDSGGPSFAEVNGGQQALVGIHLGIENESPTIQRNYSTFLPHYATRVDTILAPDGHRMMPVNYSATTLQIPAVTPGPLRRFTPGQIGFSVANNGSQLTGNLAVTVSFPAGHQPDSLTAAGWVVEAAGSGTWNLRAATLAAGANLAFTANWSALPDLASISASITADSDTANPVTANPSFTLGSSYAEWADGLAQPGQTADPDGDGLENLLEYAFGGDPASGAMTLPGGHPLLPVMTLSGGTVSLSFPERGDAVLRGISYLVETAASPASLAGSTTLPAGATSSTAPFSPAVPGFVKRTITWPADGPKRFARVRVELAE
jgi:hypothetical protein